MLVSLIIWRKEFFAVSDASTRFAPVAGFLFTLGVAVLSGIFIIYFRHGDQLASGSSLKDVVLTVFEGLIGLTGPTTFNSERVTDVVGITLAALGIFTLVVPLWLFFRRVAPQPKETPEEVELIKSLIKHLF